MNLKRLWVLFVARNYEFLRDRAGFGWNILFPFLLVAGFGVAFSGDTPTRYKLGVFPLIEQEKTEAAEWAPDLKLPAGLTGSSFIQVVPFEQFQNGMGKLVHHKIDMLIKNGTPPYEYWISDASPKGWVMEKVLRESVIAPGSLDHLLKKSQIQGDQIRYIDWLFPGILGMNIMFSALFGVGYVIVRYRKIGVLKRLKATPVTAFEYLTAQLMSRVIILMGTAAVVWLGCDFLFSFNMQGSYLDAAVVFLLGTVSMVSLGLVVASRGTSEELTNGVINFITWPMMFLSEVWFSLEGASSWVKTTAKVFPLTHFLGALRKIINDGADLSMVTQEMMVLAVMTTICLTIGSLLFSWTR